MGYFLTSKSRIEQTDTNGYWRLIDNELYMSNDGQISLTPRYFWTDGYTIPAIFSVLLGDKNYYDTRPAHAHDLFCRFHQRVIVKLSLFQLKHMGYLHENTNNKIVVCEDIPKKYLDIIPITKVRCDDLLQEMMLSCKVKSSTCNIVRFGVFFNLNWFRTGKKDLNAYDIYNEDIGLVDGL